MRKLLLISLIIISLVFALNIQVYTRQGINCQLQTLKIPLYLKLLDFFDRHFNYKQMVKGIIKDSQSEEERVMKIFAWTCENIRRPPRDWPIMDDHVWYIIVRGYGLADQSSDVFTTLCNYAGIRAFYHLVYSQDKKSLLPLSFVKIRDRWVVFDPWRRVYFKDRDGNIADIETLKHHDWIMEVKGEKPDLDYSLYFSNMPSAEEVGLTRASIQSPLNRLLFEIKRRIQHF